MSGILAMEEGMESGRNDTARRSEAQRKQHTTMDGHVIPITQIWRLSMRWIDRYTLNSQETSSTLVFHRLLQGFGLRDIVNTDASERRQEASVYEHDGIISKPLINLSVL